MRNRETKVLRIAPWLNDFDDLPKINCFPVFSPPNSKKSPHFCYSVIISSTPIHSSATYINNSYIPSLSRSLFSLCVTGRGFIFLGRLGMGCRTNAKKLVVFL
jgi:hypothetical protein